MKSFSTPCQKRCYFLTTVWILIQLRQMSGRACEAGIDPLAHCNGKELWQCACFTANKYLATHYPYLHCLVTGTLWLFVRINVEIWSEAPSRRIVAGNKEALKRVNMFRFTPNPSSNRRRSCSVVSRPSIVWPVVWLNLPTASAGRVETRECDHRAECAQFIAHRSSRS